jgi:periplasmic copper chaperone A
MSSFFRNPRAICSLAGAALLASAFALSAQSGAGGASKPDARTPAAAASPSIEDAWVRRAPPRAPVLGGFASIRNTGKTPERLLSARSADAGRVEIHEMRMDEGVMRMRRVQDGLEIAPGRTLSLRPGGYHLMLFEPKRTFAAGETIEIVLRFERAGERRVRFEVREAAPASHDHH